MTPLRKLVAVSALASISVFGVACGDEDGDGGTADEEINQLEEKVEDGVETGKDKLEEGVEQGKEEIQQGRDEIDDSDQQNDDDQ